MTQQEIKAKLEEYRQGFKRLPQETQAERIHQLACRVVLEAMVDYLGETTVSDRQSLPKYIFDKSVIMKDLKGAIIMAKSDGANEMAIAALRNNPEAVRKNIRQMSYGCDFIKVETHDKPQFR